MNSSIYDGAAYLQLPSGVMLPVDFAKDELDHPYPAPERVLSPGVVIGHGLGLSHEGAPPHFIGTVPFMRHIQPCAAKELGVSSIVYTARGMGRSKGWENGPPEQFLWSALADDMESVATGFGMHSFIACGESMGASTAIYCALKYPERVRALVLVRPPTAWELRAERKAGLVDMATKMKTNDPDNPKWKLMIGAASADLPAIDSGMYAAIRCPTLILATEGDPMHPVDIAKKLAELITGSSLAVASATTVGAASALFESELTSFFSHLREAEQTHPFISCMRGIM